MDAKQKEKILEKIRKCFALSKSDNPHEAAQAIKQAQALIKKHGLDECIVDIGEIKQSENLYYSNTMSGSYWLDCLLAIIQRTFNVKAISYNSYKETPSYTFKPHQTIRLIGHPSDIMIAEYAWCYLSKLLKKARTNYIKSLSLHSGTSGRGKSKKGDVFATGWCAGIRDELKTLQRTPDEDEYKETQDKNTKFITALHGNLEAQKSKETPLNNLSDTELVGYFKGVEEAEKVTISRAVNGAEQMKLLAG